MELAGIDVSRNMITAVYDEDGLDSACGSVGEHGSGKPRPDDEIVVVLSCWFVYEIHGTGTFLSDIENQMSATEHCMPG